MNLYRMQGVYSGEGYPLYTKRIMDICDIYIKDRIVLKNSKDKPFDCDEEVKYYNNIAIENKYGYVDIFCSKEKEKDYTNIINELKQKYNRSIDNNILVHYR